MSKVWVIVQIWTRLGFDGDRRILEAPYPFVVMCKAYGGEPSLDLLRAFLNLGPTGWKGSFFFIKNKIVPSKYPDLLLEENKLGKKSFKDVVPLHVQEDPLYNQTATYPCNMDFRSFMVGGIDGEFHFDPEGGFAYGEEKSPSNRSINNEALVIDIAPLNSTPPSHVAENVGDSDEVSSGGDIIGEAKRLRKSLKVTSKRKHATGPSVKEGHHKLRKAPPQASKVVGDASDPLDVDSDLDIHGKFYTFSAFFVLSTCGSKLIFVFLKFPSAKELKDSVNCHFVVAYVVLDNMLNSQTRQLMSALEKVRASYDVIREREIKKDKAYAELERNLMKLCRIWKKNPLVLDMRAEIEILEGQVDGLHIKGLELQRERLKNSKTQLMQDIDSLKQDRATVVSKVVPDMATKLILSDEIRFLVAKLVKAAMFRGRCAAFQEVASLKEPFILEKMPGYRSSLKEEFDRAIDGLANTSYPFLAEVTADHMPL
ncbi:hypothetical protein Tco_1376746 [Tanacetum coccineum]